MLSDLSSPLFSDYENRNAKSENTFSETSLEISASESKLLLQSARNTRVTLNTLMEGIWMLTLSDYFEQNDITIGLTVSGRSVDFDGIDRVTGLFMSVLPIRMQIEKDENTVTWLKKLQQTHSHMRQFEFIDIEGIRGWVHKPGRKEIFDSLFVFGNFMNENVSIGNLELEEYSGEFSSTYPLTVRVNPATSMGINFRYDKQIIEEKGVQWLKVKFESMLKLFSTIESFESNTITDLISGSKVTLPRPQLVLKEETNYSTLYQAPGVRRMAM